MNKEYLGFLFKKLFEAEDRLKEYKNEDYPAEESDHRIAMSIALNREFISAESAIEMYLFHHK